MKFSEAAEVRIKINHLKVLEEEKAKDELRKLHEDEKFQIELEKQEEFRVFNQQYDMLQNDIVKRFEELGMHMKDQQSTEEETMVKEFLDSFAEKNPKATPEILDLNRKLQGIVKNKE
jgi:hypothetical protein